VPVVVFVRQVEEEVAGPRPRYRRRDSTAGHPDLQYFLQNVSPTPTVARVQNLEIVSTELQLLDQLTKTDQSEGFIRFHPQLKFWALDQLTSEPWRICPGGGSTYFIKKLK
jgi:hypothetical protein